MLKKISKKVCAVTLVVAMICSFLTVTGEIREDVKAASIPEYVVVLDAGHDASHSGAQNKSNGYQEEVLTYKIASYCKEELEKHEGVKVYMVRDSYSCPFGGSSVKSQDCNSKRVEFAKKVNADLYISFHLNSAGASARGVSVYYPNSNYRPEIGQNGRILANDIIGRLEALGIPQNGRGTLIRNSEDNTRYPDGSLADYLAVIKGNKKNNIPAVLIEHCFISNASDCNDFLSSEAKIKNLGTADANGIMDYLGINTNSLRQAADGSWYIYRNGAIDYSYTGLALHSGKWWYVKKGKVDFSEESLVYFRNVWCYIKNGMYQSTFNGMIKNSGGYWYVKNGKVDFSFSGVAECDNSQVYGGKTYNYSGWYYFEKGKYISDKTTLAQANGSWWYVHNGKIDFSANTLAQNNIGWWYIKDGKVDFSFNGIARYGAGDWYVHNGLVDFSYNGLYRVDNLTQHMADGETITFDGWYSFINGKVDKSYTDLIYDGKEWQPVTDENRDSTYTGIVMNAGDNWFVKDGKIYFEFTGLLTDENKNTWYVENGKISVFTGSKELDCQEYDLATDNINDINGLYYFTKGKINKKYTGIVESDDALWYLEKGQINQDIDSLIQYKNIWYYFKDGKCDKSFKGMAQNNMGCWYINNGKVDFTFSGMAPCYNSQNYNGKTYEYAGWYCFSNGRFINNVDKLEYINGNWWYVHNGVIDFKEDTLVHNNIGWWYVNKGRVDFSFNGIAKYKNEEWYVKNGKVDVNFSGMAPCYNSQDYNGKLYEYAGWYCFKNGKFVSDVDKLEYINGNWWYVHNGVIDFTENTLVQNNIGWWYVHNGRVDFSFNGIARNQYGDWYINNGKVDFNVTGLVQSVNKHQIYPDNVSGEDTVFDGWYYVYKGKVQYGKESLVQNNIGWWYVGTDGKVDFTKNTLTRNNVGLWYVKNGLVDFSYNGQFEYNGIPYDIKSGRVQEN